MMMSSSSEESREIMSRKRETAPTLSQTDNDQIQRLLAEYHQIAQDLHQSQDHAQAEAALAPINELSEAVQIAWLKALARENSVDAADVLLAANELSPHKEVRKEARRSLIRLEATKTYPQWQPPRVQSPAIQVNVPNAPRFWKGVVTQMREQGELQLTLCWEQGYDYSEARAFIFLLDYWQEGVKDLFVEMGTKRRIDERISEMRSKTPDVPYVDCTLAEGKRLIEEALDVNTWRGTRPAQEYRTYLSQINNLIMQASDPGEDRGYTFINPELTDQEVAINFIGGWSLGDFGLTYDLLTESSPIKEGLPREEWVARHRAWADEAHPARLELGFVHEQERSQSALWVPSVSFGGNLSARKEIGIGWSLELSETPLSGTLKEMAMGTAINKETGRHWFWTTYTLARENNAWRIQSITDEGARVQGLTITELQQRIKEYEDAIEDTFQKVQQRSISNLNETMEELSWRLTQLLHFYDALIIKLPLDRRINEDAYERAVVVGNPERTIVYLERLAQRFPENRGDVLRRLGSTLAGLAYSDRMQEMKERREHLLERAEATLRESIAVDDSAFGHILLGELLSSMDRLDEAEAELLRARSLNPGHDEEATIESGLGAISMQRDQVAEAIPHYQRVAALRPDHPGNWFNLGLAQRVLRNLDEAAASFERAIEAEPHDPRPYAELVAIYMNRSDKRSARDIAERGVRANPGSAPLHAMLASVLFDIGDQRGAQRQLEEAESLDPESELVRNMRRQMNTAKKRS
jgi:tetratricopeptide (TPR) repeat protein